MTSAFFGSRQDLDQRILVKVFERRDNRQTTDEFRDEAELDQVFRLEIAQHLADAALVRGLDLGAEADRGLLPTGGDHLFEAGESAAADEQDVRRIDLQEFLLRMLAATLRRNRSDRAFHDLQKRLLNAFARNVAGDRGVVGLAPDLVDFIDIDDAALGALDIVVGGLQQLQDDVFDVFADVACFGERRGVGHGERHVDDARQRLGKIGLAAAGGANEQDVGLRQFDILVLGGVREALVMVMNGDRQDALGLPLADHDIRRAPS